MSKEGKNIQAELQKPEPANKKYLLLGLSILFDGIGMISYFVPGLGETMDAIWAPVAGLLNYAMFGGTLGKIGGLTTLLEEAIPGTDIIPSFTLTWLARYQFGFGDKKEGPAALPKK